MRHRDKPQKRDGGGRFAPGGTGGPGRPAGTGEHRSALLNACGPDEVAEIVTALVEKAKQGDAVAARVLFERIWGRPRDGSIVEAAAAIVAPTPGPPVPDARTFAEQLEQASRIAREVLSRDVDPME